MFSDTITLTINSVPKTLVRINQDSYSSEYMLKETLGCFRLRLRNTSYQDKSRGAAGTTIKVNRHNVELIHEVYPAASAVFSTFRKAYLVFENDDNDNATDPVKMTAGLIGFLSEANLTKLLNWES